MKNVFAVVDETFRKSAVKDISDYLKELHYTKWMIFSDYCINDKNKPNDVLSFTVMPYYDEFDKIKNMLLALSPKDIKNIKKVKQDFLKFLKEAPILNISFVLNEPLRAKARSFFLVA